MLPLGDAVFEISLWNIHRRHFGPLRHPEEIEIGIPGTRYPLSGIEDAKQRVGALLRAAGIPGDAFHDNPLDHARRKVELIAAHPGFSASTYTRAIDYGLYITR